MDLVDVEHGKVRSDTTLTWIDVTSKWENIISICGMLIIMGMTIYTGTVYYAPIKHDKTDRFFTNSSITEFRFEASPVSGYNRFLEFDLQYIPASSAIPSLPISFNYTIEAMRGDQRVIKAKQDVSTTAEFSNGASQKMTLFREQYVDYQALILTISPKNQDKTVFKGITMSMTFGYYYHTLFQGYFKFMYSVFAIWAMVLLLRRIGWRDLSRWAIEQRLAVPLLILGPLSNNPLFVSDVFKPRPIWTLLDAIATPVFHSYVYFHILMIMSLLSGRGESVASVNIMRNCGIVAVSGVCEFLSRISAFAASFKPIAMFDKGPSFAWKLETLGYAFVCVFLCRAIFQAGMNVADPERLRFMLYTIQASSIVIVLGIIEVGTRLLWGRSFASIEWVCVFVCHNFYVMLTTYHCWPYVSSEDQEYIVEKGDNEDSVDGVLDIVSDASESVEESVDSDTE